MLLRNNAPTQDPKCRKDCISTTTDYRETPELEARRRPQPNPAEELMVKETSHMLPVIIPYYHHRFLHTVQV